MKRRKWKKAGWICIAAGMLSLTASILLLFFTESMWMTVFILLTIVLNVAGGMLLTTKSRSSDAE